MAALAVAKKMGGRADINRSCGALIREQDNYTMRYTMASVRTKFSHCHSDLVRGPSSPLDRTNQPVFLHGFVEKILT